MFIAHIGAATAGATATAAVAATTAAVAVASAAGLGFIGDSATTARYCDYPNLGYRNGNITMFLEGIPRQFTPREAILVQDVLVEAYNNVSGICADVYQREMLNATLVQQRFFAELSGTPNVLVRSFTVSHNRTMLRV